MEKKVTILPDVEEFLLFSLKYKHCKLVQVAFLQFCSLAKQCETVEEAMEVAFYIKDQFPLSFFGDDLKPEKQILTELLKSKIVQQFNLNQDDYKKKVLSPDFFSYEFKMIEQTVFCSSFKEKFGREIKF